MIVVSAPAPIMLVPVARISKSPVAANCSPAPGTARRYVPAGSMIVVPGLVFALMMAPRKLQSAGAAVHADNTGTSRVVSTVMVGPGGNIGIEARAARAGSLLSDLSGEATIGRSPLERSACDSRLNPIVATSPTVRKQKSETRDRMVDRFMGSLSCYCSVHDRE